MDGVEILGTMAAEGAPWWAFFMAVSAILVAIAAIAFADLDDVDNALIAIATVAFSILLGAMLSQLKPEKQIALISDNASYISVEEQYKVTKIDDHLYFLEVLEE